MSSRSPNYTDRMTTAGERQRKLASALAYLADDLAAICLDREADRRRLHELASDINDLSQVIHKLAEEVG